MEARPPAQADLPKLIKRAQRGSKSAAQSLAPLLKAQTSEVLNRLGWTSQVMDLVAEQNTGPRARLSGIILKEQADRMVQDLAGPNPSPTEALLAEQAALNWMVLRAAELQLEGDDETDPQASAWKRSKVNSAHRRYLASLKTLAQIRKLMTPTLLQINVDQRVDSKTPRISPPIPPQNQDS